MAWHKDDMNQNLNLLHPTSEHLDLYSSTSLARSRAPQPLCRVVDKSKTTVTTTCESSEGARTSVKSGEQVVFHDVGAAGRIYQGGAGLHAPQKLGVDEAPRLGRQRQQTHNDVLRRQLSHQFAGVSRYLGHAGAATRRPCPRFHTVPCTLGAFIAFLLGPAELVEPVQRLCCSQCTLHRCDVLAVAHSHSVGSLRFCCDSQTC